MVERGSLGLPDQGKQVNQELLGQLLRLSKPQEGKKYPTVVWKQVGRYSDNLFEARQGGHQDRDLDKGWLIFVKKTDRALALTFFNRIRLETEAYVLSRFDSEDPNTEEKLLRDLGSLIEEHGIKKEDPAAKLVSRLERFNRLGKK